MKCSRSGACPGAAAAAIACFQILFRHRCAAAAQIAPGAACDDWSAFSHDRCPLHLLTSTLAQVTVQVSSSTINHPHRFPRRDVCNLRSSCAICSVCFGLHRLIGCGASRIGKAPRLLQVMLDCNAAAARSQNPGNALVTVPPSLS